MVNGTKVHSYYKFSFLNLPKQIHPIKAGKQDDNANALRPNSSQIRAVNKLPQICPTESNEAKKKILILMINQANRQ